MPTGSTLAEKSVQTYILSDAVLQRVFEALWHVCQSGYGEVCIKVHANTVSSLEVLTRENIEHK